MGSGNATDTTHEFMVELIDLVAENDLKAVERLLRSRADITEDMLAPSMVKTAVNGYTEMARLLIANGANVNNQNSIGSTPLMVAAYWGYTETVRLLIDNGADLNLADESGHTALMRAALADRAEMTRLLIDCGADIDARAHGGHTAQAFAKIKGHGEIVQLVEEARGRPHHALAFENQRRLNSRTFKPKIIKGLQP